ncbi:hypothetical protein CYMTET_42098 [Cymbomonas tetramitiformis]|uniref:Uncharacterized protein n=1 Tax=Cymbomonas tetramitiformis TaxID=36881 RepID=A0AAE0F1K6_9CHLO|nr:hypothetical protein CYMTET_42098 [Cymbomonas tetramitiformis]
MAGSLVLLFLLCVGLTSFAQDLPPPPQPPIPPASPFFPPAIPPPRSTTDLLRRLSPPPPPPPFSPPPPSSSRQSPPPSPSLVHPAPTSLLQPASASLCLPQPPPALCRQALHPTPPEPPFPIYVRERYQETVKFQINFANLDIYDASFQFLDDFALQVATAASSYKGNFDRNGFQAVIDTSSVGNEGVSPVDITVDGDDYYGTLILATVLPNPTSLMREHPLRPP